MSWTYSDEEYKEYTRDTWNESASRYTPLLRNLDLYTPDLLEALAPAQGERILDVATGPGEPALTIAEMVGAEGEVVGIDLSDRMIDRARTNAKERDVENLDLRVMDAESMEFDDGSFDAVTSRFGIQIMTDPDRALAELRRVTRDGGRCAFVIWGPGETTPALHAAVSPMIDLAEPDETGYIPTPYEISGPGQLQEMVATAGFRDATEHRVVRHWTFRDADEYIEGIFNGSPLGHSLREEDEEVQRQVLSRTRENLKQYETADGLRLAGEAVVVGGRA